VPFADNGGTVRAEGGSATYMLGGSSLFVSELEGDMASYGALVRELNAIALRRFAAVVVARFASRDVRVDALRALGFADDVDTFDGYVSLVRDVR
jgi:hypothetical protein